VDPTDPVLRYELTRLGRQDPDLWPHLGADANRLLDVADHYLSARLRDEAHVLLDRDFPLVASPMREPGAVAPGESPLVAYYRDALADGHGAASPTSAARSTAYSFPNRPRFYSVLGRALRSDPDDHAARFLLGSQYLASGLVDRAIEAWQPIRSIRPAIPTLHRSLALALLHGRNDVTAARTVLEQGTTADPQNVEVYLTLDGVLSAAGAPPRQRVAALERFPATGTLPSSLVFKLAIALAESGDAAAAERLFHGRFFPREEGGANVRTVYAQVLLSSSRASARAGRCADALRQLDAAPRERQELAFTAGGLADTLSTPLMARQAAAVESRCGRTASARQRWERLAQPLAAGAAPLSVAIAHDARRRLGRPVTAAERRRVAESLDAATRSLESGTTSSPGTLELARAMLLAALGRAAESRTALQRVFVYPDRNLSHAFARLTMFDERAAPAVPKPARAQEKFDIEKEGARLLPQGPQ
jgi:tetratricopeptide (TPR) repeat protein